MMNQFLNYVLIFLFIISSPVLSKAYDRFIFLEAGPEIGYMSLLGDLKNKDSFAMLGAHVNLHGLIFERILLSGGFNAKRNFLEQNEPIIGIGTVDVDIKYLLNKRLGNSFFINGGFGLNQIEIDSQRSDTGIAAKFGAGYVIFPDRNNWFSSIMGFNLFFHQANYHSENWMIFGINLYLSMFI